MLKIENLEISYGESPVVQNLSTNIMKGSLIGLIGPNGAGKTSFLLTISGQFKPQGGTVQYSGYDIYEKNIEFKREIGFVHENPFFYSYLTTIEFLQFVADVKGIPETEAKNQIPELLKLGNIWDEREKLTSNLSQGMKKKLAIATALIGSPQIVFLDEALNGVDFESAFQIKNALKEFVAKGGTVILSTHVLEVIEKICDRYIVLKNGKIISDLKAKDFQNISHQNFEKYIIEKLQSE